MWDCLWSFVSIQGDYGGVAYLDLLFVHPRYRSQGIGSKLLEKIEAWALSHAFHYLWLYTESNKNIEYYKKRGFYYVGKHKKAWLGENEHILAKVLRDTPFDEVFK